MLDIYLHMYKLPVMVDPYVDKWQQLLSKYNHCAIGLGPDIIVHCFDDYVIPKWITPKVDAKLFPVEKEIVLAGQTSIDISKIRDYSNSLPRFNKYNQVSRHIWAYTYCLWPKRNDCVHKCSLILNYIFGTKIITSTPDMLLQEVKCL